MSGRQLGEHVPDDIPLAARRQKHMPEGAPGGAHEHHLAHRAVTFELGQAQGKGRCLTKLLELLAEPGRAGLLNGHGGPELAILRRGRLELRGAMEGKARGGHRKTCRDRRRSNPRTGRGRSAGTGEAQSTHALRSNGSDCRPATIQSSLGAKEWRACFRRINGDRGGQIKRRCRVRNVSLGP